MDDESWQILMRSWVAFTAISCVGCAAMGLIIGWAIWGT